MKHRNRFIHAVGILLMPVFAIMMMVMMSGCRQQSATSQSNASANVTSYDLRGEVVSVDGQAGMVTVNHEAIPGFMDAMTMTYKLKDANVATELHPGDHITAELLVGKDDDDLQLDQVVITSQAMPDYVPMASYHVPQPGETVPNFSFLDQSGRMRHIHDYRGRVVLITFIYTRCPLPDFCVRMSRNFAKIDKALSTDPSLYAKTHLLSISFDPAYDTPAVLRSYGEAYTGRYTKETFQRWEFAVTPQKELDKVEEYFDLGVTPEKDHTLSHSLSTMVVGRDGKVVAWYPNNDWSPQEVVDVMQKAAQGM